MKRFIIFIIISFFTSGCLQQIAINSIGEIIDSGFDVLNEEQDLDIAEKSIASNLKLLESLLRKDPQNEHFLLLASIGYSSYALGFVQDDNNERAKIFYRRGKDYGLQILDDNKKFAKARHENIEEFRTALWSFSKNDVPAVFWTAIGWGSFISLSLDDPNALVDLPKVEAMMRFVLENDSAYFYGGAHFFLGTLYGSRPKILGGDPEISQKHFERCLTINNGKFLMTFVYYARSFAVQTQNRELFKQCLAKVADASLDVLPQARLSNAIAKRKAKLLMEKIEDLF